jgi:hypothetical protein
VVAVASPSIGIRAWHLLCKRRLRLESETRERTTNMLRTHKARGNRTILVLLCLMLPTLTSGCGFFRRLAAARAATGAATGGLLGAATAAPTATGPLNGIFRQNLLPSALPSATTPAVAAR